MIPYAAYTTNRRSRAALVAADWRIMLSPATGLEAYGRPYALDNGKWSDHVGTVPWSEPKFLAALQRMGHAADFVVAPDIVEGGLASMALSRAWLDRCLAHCPRVLIAVQDGMSCFDVIGVVGPRVGIFIGGSTGWKEATMGQWGAFARREGIWCHVGRVNTVRRVALCAAAGATSFDGSSVSRFAKTLPNLDRASRQRDLLVI